MSGCGDGGCGSKSEHTKEHAQNVVDDLAMEERMAKVRNKILVLSGKGGVGKSTVAVNLAQALANKGKRVGLLDIDVHGPSVPVMLGLTGQRIGPGPGESLQPVLFEGMKVMSIGFMLPDDDSPVIWRGPLKMGVIKQFLTDVEWGELDYLIVDAPPGTGDEPLSVCQFLTDARALIVSTPQAVATMDVRKSITFCRQLKIDVIGLVENMNGMVCPHCNEHIKVFPDGHVDKMAKDMGLPVLVSLPMDPSAAQGADEGRTFVEYMNSPMGKAIQPLVDKISG